MTLSLCEASVDVFVPYLGNLSALLDHAAAHARATTSIPRPAQYAARPTMYDLTRQVGEANRHAVVACALLGRPRAVTRFR